MESLQQHNSDTRLTMYSIDHTFEEIKLRLMISHVHDQSAQSLSS